MGIKIQGTGSYVPEKVLTNADLEKIVDTNDEWITTRSGIKERHIAAEGVATSDLALEASMRALEMAGTSAGEIDLVVVATITQDKHFPSAACILQRKLGAANAVCFDLHAACSGLLYSLTVVRAMMMADKRYRRALVVGAEKLTSLVDWEDRGTCVLFGDGAGAVVLGMDSAADDFLVASDLGADGCYEDILHVPAGGSLRPATHESIEAREHYMKMAGQEVFKLAVTAMSNSCRKVLDESGVPLGKVRWLIPHQANSRIIVAVGRRLGIDPANVYINVDRFGNTSAASIGLALDEIVRNGEVEDGEYLLLTAFGAGLTWGALLIRWQ